MCLPIYFDLSIIIPHYNSSKLLINLIHTIPIRKNIEIIIIDDKSDSSHIEEIECFLFTNNFDNLKFIKNYTDIKGAGVCRNIGLYNANGKWVLFADADDYLTDNFYFKIEPYFKTNNDVVFFTPTSVYIDTQKIAFRHIHYKEVISTYINFNDINGELNLRYNMASPCSKLISRKFLNNQKIIFDEIIVSNDVMFSLKVGHCMKIFHVSNDVIYVITRNFGSLTTDMSEYIYDIRLSVLIKRLNFLKKIITKDELRLLKYYYRSVLLNSFRYGIIKFIKVSKIFYYNDIKIYDKKFLNPFLFANKLAKLIKHSDSKYNTSNIKRRH